MNLQNAMSIARNYVVWGDPNGDMGSFEPLQGEFKKEEKIWEITCRYTKKRQIKEALVIVDDDAWYVVGFQLLKEY